MNDCGVPPVAGTRVAPSASREVAAMRAVLDVSANVAASLDLDALLERILDAIERLVPAARSSIILDVPGRDVLQIAKVRGMPEYVARVQGTERPIDGSLTGRCYRLHAPYIVDDFLDPVWRPHVYLAADPPDKYIEVRSGLFMPLVADRCVGVAFLARRGVRQFTGEDLHILSLFAPLVAIAVTNARRYAAVQAHAAQLHDLVMATERFTTAQTFIAGGDPLVRFSTVIAEEAGRIVPHNRTTVSRCDPGNETYRSLVYLREGIAMEPKGPFRRGEGITGWAIETGKPVLVNDAQADPRSLYFYGEDRETLHEHVIVMPLVVAGRVTGALTVIRRDAPPFTEEEFSCLLILARLAAASMEHVAFLAQLREQNAALVAASKHKDTFLTHMSHELRTPLNAVIGFAHLLADGVIENADERAEAYRDILESGRHLLTMVNYVLDVARIEAGQEWIACVPLPLAPVIAAAERICAPLFIAKEQTFTCDLPDPTVTVLADADRLLQVLLNLLSNAQKFTPEGGSVIVRVSHTEDDRVRIAVTDTGIGIAPEHHAFVFEAFRQVETGYARAQQGTGLGLALTRHLVELMAGEIILASIPGSGSTFTVALRAAV